MDKRIWGLDELYKYSMGSSPTNNNQNNANCLDTNFCKPAPQSIPDDVLTMAFVNFQPLESVYPPETAFCNGTLFPNLNKPFYGGMTR